ncbi:MAG: hypothetical protein ACRETE_05935, partial [Stenotrophobium sp.]
LEPAHFTVNAAYTARKGKPDAARNWLAGQAESANLLLGNLAALPEGGVFPELAYFDCNACHHSMFADRASAARTAGQMPGTVPLADDSLLMLSHWLAQGDPALAARWNEGRERLYGAIAHGNRAQLRSRALELRSLLRERIVPATRATLDPAQIHWLMNEIISEDIDRLSGDFSHAEQTAMALTVLFTDLQQRGSADVTPRLQQAVDALYAAVKDRDRYAPAAYRAAVEQTRSALRGPAEK